MANMKVIDTAKELGEEAVLDRLVIQIYNEDMYAVVKEIYPFQSYIFTLYQRWLGDIDEFIKICRWCVVNHVDAVTMPEYYFYEDNRDVARRYNIDLYVHTLNDVPRAQELIKQGVRGIYTDDIMPVELEEER